jgi:hypothetical protein
MAVMNVLPPINLRTEKTDAVRRWAAWEGKSRAMSDDLWRQHAVPVQASPGKLGRLARVAEFAALTVEAVRLLRSS